VPTSNILKNLNRNLFACTSFLGSFWERRQSWLTRLCGAGSYWDSLLDCTALLGPSYYHSRRDDQGSAFSAMSVAAFGQ
jgi:hypothetical protein